MLFRSKKLFHEILHFGIIGVFNTLLGFVLIMVFYNLWHWNYWAASGTSYVIGSIFSYFANKKLTFRVEGNSWKAALKFAVNIAICYLLAYGIAKPLARSVMRGYLPGLAQRIGDVIHMEARAVEENVAILAGMGLFIIFNFIGQKFFVFIGMGKEKEQV